MKSVKQLGLSLVELIIGIALASVIIAGVIQVFLANREAFNMTESLGRIQENGRFAVNYISNAIRQSGSYGCVPAYSSAQQNILSQIGGFTDFNAIQTSSGDGAVNAGAFSNPDNLDLLQLTEDSTTVNAALVVPGTLPLDASGSEFDPGDWVLVSNCLVGDYVVAGAATTDVSLDVSNSAAFRLTQYNRLDETTLVSRIRRLSFTVDAANETLQVEVDNSGTPQDLIDGIENIQFTYGVDQSDDFNPDYFDDYANIPVADRDKIIAVKVMVLAVSNLEAAADIVSDFKTINFNGQSVEIQDRRLRKVFESIVTLRNQVN